MHGSGSSLGRLHRLHRGDDRHDACSSEGTMSKRSNRRRRVPAPDRSTSTDVVSQLECAFKNPHAALIGALIGGLVPWFGRTLAHDEIPGAWSSGNDSLALAMLAVVLGCACFSAISVYKFGKAAFGDSKKALGFVLALEGVMLVSRGATSNAALAVLILINAVANGSVIALSREATNKRREADARRAATRARGRTTPPAAHERVPAAPVARPTPIEVIDAGTPAKPRRSGSSVQVVKVPRWRRPTLDDAIDAEIVSEERLLA